MSVLAPFLAGTFLGVGVLLLAWWQSTNQSQKLAEVRKSRINALVEEREDLLEYVHETEDHPGEFHECTAYPCNHHNDPGMPLADPEQGHPTLS